MKKLLLLFYLFVINDLTAQVYENVYANSSNEVRSKIDYNKMNGFPMLKDVEANYTFVLLGFNKDLKLEIEKGLIDKYSCSNLNFSEDLRTIQFTTKASNPVDVFDVYFNEHQIKIAGFSTNYSLNAQ